MIAVFKMHKCTGLDKINSTEFLSFVILLRVVRSFYRSHYSRNHHLPGAHTTC